MRKSQKRIVENSGKVRTPASKVVISVSELRRIVREELASVMKAERKGWLQTINKQNKAIERAKKGTLNKPD